MRPLAVPLLAFVAFSAVTFRETSVEFEALASVPFLLPLLLPLWGRRATLLPRPTGSRPLARASAAA